jgi:hypothetical protein
MRPISRFFVYWYSSRIKYLRTHTWLIPYPVLCWVVSCLGSGFMKILGWRNWIYDTKDNLTWLLHNRLWGLCFIYNYISGFQSVLLGRPSSPSEMLPLNRNRKIKLHCSLLHLLILLICHKNTRLLHIMKELTLIPTLLSAGWTPSVA